MSFLISSSGLTTRHILQYGALSRTYSTPVRPSFQSIAYKISARFNSRSTRPAAKSTRPASSSERPTPQRGAKVTKVGDGSVNRAWPSSNSVRIARQPSVANFPKKPAVQPAKPPHLTKPTRSVKDVQPRQGKSSGNEYSHKDQESDAYLRSTTRGLMWSGIWSLLAVANTYGLLAYLDVKAGIPSSDGSQLPERPTMSHSWYLTPTVISEGIKATLAGLDGVTIGVILANTAMWLPPVRRLLGRSGLRGLRNYQVSRHSWSYGAKKAVGEGVPLVLFLPGVVHYFDGDVFHIAAFMISVPLITLNLWNLAVRCNLIPPISMILSPRYGGYAIFGVYCVAYATEKMWIPQTLIFRLEPWSLLLAQVSLCGYFLARGPTISAKCTAMVCIGLSTLIEHVLTPYRRFCSVLCLAAHMPYST